MGGACSTIGEEEEHVWLLVGKVEGKWLLGRPKRSWLHNIRIGPIGLAQDRNRCRARPIQSSSPHPNSTPPGRADSLPPSVSRLSRICVSINISQPYKSSRQIRRIALHTFTLASVPNVLQRIISRFLRNDGMYQSALRYIPEGKPS
jgi:hypothetical protein